MKYNSRCITDISTGIRYKSVTEAAGALGCSRKMIYNSINGHSIGKLRGHAFVMDDAESVRSDKNSKAKEGRMNHCRPVIDKRTGKIYASIQEAATAYGVSFTCAHNCVNGMATKAIPAGCLEYADDLEDSWCTKMVVNADTGRRYLSAFDAKEKTGVNLKVMKMDLLGDGKHWRFYHGRR